MTTQTKRNYDDFKIIIVNDSSRKEINRMGKNEVR